MITYKGYQAAISFDHGAEVFHGEVVGTRDVIFFEATSVEELKREFQFSIDDYLSMCAEQGQPPDNRSPARSRCGSVRKLTAPRPLQPRPRERASTHGWPPSSSEQCKVLEQRLRFLLEADKLKQVLRRNVILGKHRRENSAEHSWHLTLMALVLVDHAAVRNLDLLRVLKMLVVHDLVEIDAGDTFAYDEAAKRDQQEREERAAERIFALLPAGQAAEMRDLWDEFEASQSPEAQFALALDRLQPMLLNYFNGGPGWQEHRVTARQVRAVNACMEQGAPELWDYAQGMVTACGRTRLPRAVRAVPGGP